MDWDEYFLRMVYLVASKSKDFRTKIGSVIVRDRLVLSTGFNGICRGVSDPADYKNSSLKARSEKPLKAEFYEHSERNSLYAAARHGISVLGATLYTQGVPCTSCTRGCIQSGIKTIIVHQEWPLNGITTEILASSDDWRNGLKYSLEMIKEAGIDIKCFSKRLNIKGFLDGQEVEV